MYLISGLVNIRYYHMTTAKHKLHGIVNFLTARDNTILHRIGQRDYYTLTISYMVPQYSGEEQN